MSRKHSTALGIGAAFSGAAVATFLSMGMAHADVTDVTTVPDADGYTDLFGGGSLPQATDDASLDAQLAENNLGYAQSFDTSVDNFQSSPFDHALQTLIYAIDPSSFVAQSDPDVSGYLTGANAGDFLVPDDTLGYLATDLDYFLLTPTGLDPLALGAIIDTLLGSPPAF